MLRRLLTFLPLALAAVTLLAAAPAHAHNSLESSDPADGATLATAPASVLLRFANAVPLDTLTVSLIDPTGARTDLAGAAHGAEERDVVVPMPPLADGTYTLRWRLVGADGHAVSGRVGFTVATAPTTTAAGPTTVPAVVPEPVAPAEDEPAATPGAVTWVLRYGAYLLLVAVVGALLVAALAGVDGAAAEVLRRTARFTVMGLAAVTALQLLTLAADIGDESLWSAWSWLDTATATNPGKAYVVRLAVCAAALAVLGAGRPRHAEVEAAVWGVLGLTAWGTWAFAGHAASLPHGWLGVPVDVAHHAAAAVWLGGLAGLAWLALGSPAVADLAPPARRFSQVAAVSVGMLVITGVVQAVRLHEGLPDIGTTHGRLLAAKVVGLGVMLFLANGNRRRVAGSFQPAVLRRALLLELGWGVAILAATSALVVSSPS